MRNGETAVYVHVSLLSHLLVTTIYVITIKPMQNYEYGSSIACK